MAMSKQAPLVQLERAATERPSATTTNAWHSLCGNPEGWGPLSPFRYDFSPCFLDVWICLVAAFGIVFGAAAAWWLVKRKEARPMTRNWHLYTKLALLVALLAVTVVQAALQIATYDNVRLDDFRVWTTFISLASLLVVTCVEYIEHNRSRAPNAVVLLFWLFYLVAHAVKLRSLVSQRAHRTALPYFVAFSISYGLASIQFLWEWLVPKPWSPYLALGEEDESPIEYADIFSRLTFAWMTPMMRYGHKEYLTEEDLWNLRRHDQAQNTNDRFEHAWRLELDKKKKPSLWIALFRAFGFPYLVGGLFKSGSDVLSFVQPQLLRLLINFIDSYRTPEPQPAIRGAAIALAMFAVATSQTVCLHQYFQRAFETGMRVKSSLVTAIYAKSLRLSNEAKITRSTGDTVNYMAVDVERLQDISQYGQQLWSAPLQIILCMVSLYELIGWSMLAGVGAMIMMVPVNGLVAKVSKTLQKRQMQNKDARSRLMAEILNNMKSIKLYAWTMAFMKKLSSVRNRELGTLRRIGALQAVANFTWLTTPFLVSCSTFAVFVLTQKRPLTADLVFPALTLFNLLTFPLAVLPLVITAIVEATVAVSRLTGFLTAEELQPDAVIRRETLTQPGAETVRIRDASFTWNKTEGRHVLRDISFSANKGTLSCIVGRVGAGKSSLLQAMLGDLYKLKGEVLAHGSVAYVAQQPWVMNTTIRENIVFGHRWDPAFYDSTVNACALAEDFPTLPDGDETEVGERGISLSGGQKARVALARAVYARSDIYLLDDILASVDQHVGRRLINRVLGPKGLLRSKTRILATNSIPVLREADSIVLLRDGSVVERGGYDELMSRNKDVASLVRASNNQQDAETEPEEGAVEGEEVRSSETGSGDGSAEESSTAVVSDDDEEEAAAGPGVVPHLESIAPDAPRPRRPSSKTLRRASIVSARASALHGRGADEEEGKGAPKTARSKEAMQQGKVKWDVYLQYAKASNLGAVAVYLVVLVANHGAQVGGNLWLEHWAESNSKTGQNQHVGSYIGIYLAFGLGSAFLTAVQTLVMVLLCSIEASRKLHEKMANAIFHSPMNFFETTPAGRILNRFSSDIYKIDEVMSRSFSFLFSNLLRAISAILLISATTPTFTAMIVPLSIVYVYYQRYYLRTSRELKRLDSTTRSPIYGHFQETLAGLATIRAYRAEERFVRENQSQVDTNMRAYFPSISANRWLAVRLEFIGSLIILAAAGLATVAVTTGRGLSAGMAGLSLSYALMITQALNWIVRQTVEVETNIVSVERVLEYARLPSEAPDIIPNNRLTSSGWPAQGAVSFQNYSARYRPELDPALRDVDVDIRPREKVGVVGRTGAGKSTLTLALFRIIEPASGTIVIDDVNTSTIGLYDLRRRLAIIPQDAALFQGTIRDNLDPGHVHADAELWAVLEHARLQEHVSSMTGQLDAAVHEAGSNLSQGQRQLISLARALLTPSNILVLDEATGSIDIETDALIQETLRTSDMFLHRTIVTIAHRINTILDSDRILVLDHGRVMEFDTPDELIRRKGLFYDLVNEAGLVNSAAATTTTAAATTSGSGSVSGSSSS